MKLASYLETNKIPDSAFAEAIGVTRQAVYRYRTGDRFPERPVLAKISEATGGEVTANDFVDAPPTAPDAPTQPERAA
jgi:transcriptional regulator with XRE-family HTH domain